MPRAVIDLNTSTGLASVKGQWKFAQGLVPGEPNEGLVSQLGGSAARLPDYDDSSWEVCTDLAKWVSKGFSFVWYRLHVTLPETVDGHPTAGVRVQFETCIDDYGEIWIDGECDRHRGAVQGFNVPHRVVVADEAKQGEQHTFALLAANGPMAAPGGAVFVRYANLAFEWREPGY
jgi:hypothetical protein